MPTRLFFRDTQTEPGTGEFDDLIVYDLAEDQGSPEATVNLRTNSEEFVPRAGFVIEVDDTVDGTSFPVSVNIPAFDGDPEVRFRVERLDDSNSVVDSSDWSAIIDSPSTSTETLTLDTAWQVGDRLRVMFQVRRAGGHGQVEADVSVQHADSHVDVELAEEQQHEAGGATGTVTAAAAGGGVAEETTTGGGAAAVGVTATGGGTAAEDEQHEDGGATATVDAQATVGGTAVESGDGGASADVTADATAGGTGSETTSGGTAATVTATATAGGTTEEQQHESGGTTTSVAATATGGGTAVEAPSGGTTTTVTVTASGSASSAEEQHEKDIDEDFDAEDGTYLSDHGDWEELDFSFSSEDSGRLQINDDTLFIVDSTRALACRNSQELSSDEYDVYLRMSQFDGSMNWWFIWVRMDAEGTLNEDVNRYCILFTESHGPYVRVDRFVDGNNTTIAGPNTTPSLAGEHEARIEVRNGSLEVFVDDVSYLYVEDQHASIVQRGRVGISGRGLDSNQWISEFTVTPSSPDEQHASGGASATVTATATSGGTATESAWGGASTTVVATATAGGTTEDEQHETGGATATVTTTTTGDGRAAEDAAGGSTTTVIVSGTAGGTQDDPLATYRLVGSGTHRNRLSGSGIHRRRLSGSGNQQQLTGTGSTR